MKKRAIVLNIISIILISSLSFAMPVSDNDLWQNAQIGNHSAELNSSNGSSIDGFFDGKEGTYGTEAGNAIFVGGASESVHSIEWTTANAVTVQSINFVTYHDFDDNNIYDRGIEKFNLYYSAGNDWISFYQWEYSNPNGDFYYGGGPSYQFTDDQHYMTRSYLELTANLATAVTAQAFKADFVQYGTSGSRIVELDAYPELQPIPEPATWSLFAFGLLGFAGLSRTFNKNSNL